MRARSFVVSSSRTFVLCLAACAGSFTARAAAQDFRLKLLVDSVAMGATSIEPDVGINDRGMVAFAAVVGGISQGYVWDRGTIRAVALALGQRTYSGAAINDAPVPSVAFREREPGVPQVFRIRKWLSDGSGTNTLIGASQTHFNSATNFVDINDSGVVSFTGLVANSSQTALFADTTAPPDQLATFPGNVPLRPQLSDNNRIVLRDQLGAISVWPVPSGAPSGVAGTFNGFGNLGRMPGISADGTGVAFMGDRGQGEGVFVALDTPTGWQIAFVEGEGQDGFTDIDENQRVAVRVQGSFASPTGTTVTVVFAGTQNGLAGVYSRTLFAALVGGVLQTGAFPIQSVARAGDVVGGKTIAAVNLYDPLNGRGVVAFFAGFTDGSFGIVRGALDTDGDGLYDEWEEMGLDINGDGTIDLDLPLMGANSRHKDVFVEVDSFAGYMPGQTEFDRVTAAFAHAPNSLVGNPDGQDGVRLHVQRDEETIPFETWFTLVNDWPVQFDVRKTNWFGTIAERLHANSANILEAKRHVFRYCIFADSFHAKAYTGLAELGGNDFLVALGQGTPVAGTPDEQAAVFMHELGHSLGLDHGGGDDINYKPNYHSIMNYTWQFARPAIGMWWDLAYSVTPYSILDESNLVESAGLGGPLFGYTLVGPSPERVASEFDPVDFDRDGDTFDVGVAVDLNFILTSKAPSPDEILRPFVDWSNLVYDFKDSGDFADGVHLETTANTEMDLATKNALVASCPEPGTYCTAKTSSLGCTPQIAFSGSPSLTGPNNFAVTASQVLNQKNGVLLWGTQSDALAFRGGTLCVQLPMFRLPGQSSGGNTGTNDCSGTYSVPFDQAYMSSHGLLAGSQVFAQFFTRDPGFAAPDNIGLTNALVFVVCP